ncbi:MAG TPA: ABC transporter permease [Candidatus Acidoferrales bacterium]|nr:ABC transporter permease [Candidatus Acidoferrales bacterium]
MLAYAAKRVMVAILVAITVSIISFSLLHATGDLASAIAGEGATPADIARVRHEYGLDRPLVLQYGAWAKQALRGNLGDSTFYHEPVTSLLAKRLPVTLTLGVAALTFALALAVPLGIVAALRPNTFSDRFALTVSVIGQALPSFWFGLLLILVFAVALHWLPVAGTGSWKSFVLPAITLGYYATPAFMRLTRAGMLQVLDSDYIRTARAKGLHEPTIIVKHALRNAAIPLVSLASVQFGFMLGGSVVVETVFALNGVGFLSWQSIGRADIAVVQAVVLIISLFYVVLTLLADLLNAYLDPRIRLA